MLSNEFRQLINRPITSRKTTTNVKNLNCGAPTQPLQNTLVVFSCILWLELISDMVHASFHCWYSTFFELLLMNLEIGSWHFFLTSGPQLKIWGSDGVCWSIFILNFKDRVAQKLRWIILLRGELVAFNFSFQNSCFWELRNGH